MKGWFLFQIVPITFAVWALLVYGSMSEWTVALLASTIIGAVAAAVAIALLAGVHIFGSGESEQGVIITWSFAAFTAIWVAVCVASIPIMASIPFGGVIYAILTIMWVLSIIGYIQRGGGD